MIDLAVYRTAGQGVLAGRAIYATVTQPWHLDFTYPPIALRQRIEGKVDLSVLVDERGGVTDAKVISGAGGRAGLNEAASDYVKRWKFRPATKEGVPVKTWTPVSVVFMLPR